MKFDYASTIEGVSLKDIRKVFRKTEFVNTEFLTEHLGLQKETAGGLLTKLEGQGFLAPDEHDKAWFKTTSLGKSLAASAPQRVKNKKAHELYKAFLERVEYLNSDESDFAYGIDRVVLLGSFLNPELPDYGDIDFIIRLVPKYPHGSKQQEQIEKERRSKGNYPQTIFHQIAWPQIEVLKFLKDRSRYISIDEDTNSLENIEPKGAYRIIYESKTFPLST